MICVSANSVEMRMYTLCRMSIDTGYPLLVKNDKKKFFEAYGLLKFEKEIRVITQDDIGYGSEISSGKIIVYDILSIEDRMVSVLRRSEQIYAYGIESDYVVDLSAARLRRKFLSLSIYMILSTIIPTFFFLKNDLSIAPIVAQIILSFFILSLGFLRRKM